MNRIAAYNVSDGFQTGDCEAVCETCRIGLALSNGRFMGSIGGLFKPIAPGGYGLWGR